jgi:hypothetical protein
MRAGCLSRNHGKVERLPIFLERSRSVHAEQIYHNDHIGGAFPVSKKDVTVTLIEAHHAERGASAIGTRMAPMADAHDLVESDHRIVIHS